MKLTRPKNDTIAELIAGLFIFLFVYAANSKIYDHNNFRAVLSISPFVSNYASLIAFSIPVIEFSIAILLLVPRLRKPGLILCFLLTTVFTIYIGYMMLYMPKLPCSCGGVIQQMSWKQHLFFNIALMALALWGWKLMRGNNKTEHSEPQVSGSYI